jgi:hypothetical protein
LQSGRAPHPMKFLPIADPLRPLAVSDVVAASVDPCDKPAREQLGPWRKLLRR